MGILDSMFLEKADKILFLSHLAIGDFVYLAPYLKKLSEKYPHLKLDFLIDETRGKHSFWSFKFCQKASVFDWAEKCSFFSKIYRVCSSKKVFNSVLGQVRRERYPIVVSLASIRLSRYIEYSCEISPDGFIVAVGCGDNKIDKKINVSLEISALSNKDHVSDSYGVWFKELFGLELSKNERLPSIDIPSQWQNNAKGLLEKLGVNLNESDEKRNLIFINAFASNEKRSWPIKNVEKLISNLKRNSFFSNTVFIVNLSPENIKKHAKTLRNDLLNKIFLFSATENFFQLPAILSFCNLVVSTETSTMHLARSLNIPLVALMRSKNPEWRPYGVSKKDIIFAENKKKIKSISVEVVENKIKHFYKIKI